MLINFSVENFKSIQSRKELNMMKTAARELEGTNTFTVNLNDSELALLNTATLYGANASGKSNIIFSIKAMKDIVLNSSKGQVGDLLPYEPFRLSKESRESATEFEVVFIVDGVKYQYGFSYDEKRIIDEWLYAFPKKKPQKWFLRAWNEESSEYVWDFGRSLLGEKQSWQNLTRENSLFLSTAVQFNSNQLKPLFDWFMTKLKVANSHGWDQGYSSALCEEFKDKEQVLNFLRNADAAIDDITYNKEIFDPSELPEEMPSELKNLILEKLEGEDVVHIQFMKKDLDGELIPFEVTEESDGTSRLFSFAGPWLNALKEGNILFVDELNKNLHPLLVKYLVGFFHSKKTNPKNAQLVFTTHETSILNQDVFRRDQVWFVEKDSDGRSDLYALSDFKPKKGRDDLEAHYLSGSYGALPFFFEAEYLSNGE